VSTAGVANAIVDVLAEEWRRKESTRKAIDRELGLAQDHGRQAGGWSDLVSGIALQGDKIAKEVFSRPTDNARKFAVHDFGVRTHDGLTALHMEHAVLIASSDLLADG
jgi:hypothetical protein